MEQHWKDLLILFVVMMVILVVVILVMYNQGFSDGYHQAEYEITNLVKSQRLGI